MVLLHDKLSSARLTIFSKLLSIFVDKNLVLDTLGLLLLTITNISSFWK